MAAPSSNRNPVEILAEELRERLRRGEQVDIRDYQQRYPELANEISDLFPALEMMEKLKPARTDVTGVYDGGSAPVAGNVPERIGDYRLLREVGRGGMGIVYEAEQESLGRRVAIKILPGNALLDPRHHRRFQREARAAARLHHTNIVPVYGVGQQNGMDYYVMQFIQGRGLDEVLAELKRLRRLAVNHPSPPTTPLGPVISVQDVARSLLTAAPTLAQSPEQPAPRDVVVNSPEGRPNDVPLKVASSPSIQLPTAQEPTSLAESGRHYWESVARIGLQVADSLQYAASQGVLHRDIKPSNLILDTAGHVWVTDFGLAKAAEDGEDLTHTGDIVGTLRYMAPERFEGQSDGRGDIYSLGLTLYELLVQTPAYGESDPNKLIHQVTTTEPPAPRKLNPSIPRDLETIVLKATAREPARRYQTPGEMAEDLKRFLEDRPIKARRTALRERVWRWCRRNPALASLTATVLALLMCLVAGTTLAAFHFQRLASQESKARGEAEEAQKRETEQRLLAEQAHQEAEEKRQEAERHHRQSDENFAKARAAVDDYFTRVSESQLFEVPGMQPLRRDLLSSAMKYYQGFLTQRRDDPSLKAALAATQARIGRIYTDMGEQDKGRKLLEDARKQFDELVKANPKDKESWIGLGKCTRELHDYARSISAWEQLLKDDPENTIYQTELAETLNSQGVRQFPPPNDLPALPIHQRALKLRVELVSKNPDDLKARTNLGSTLNNIGASLARHGRNDDALTLYLRALEQHEYVYKRSTHVINHGRYLAISYGNVATREQLVGHTEAALRRYQQAIEQWKRLVSENPSLPYLYSGLYTGYYRLALYQRQLGKTTEASASLREARLVLERLPKQSANDHFNLAVTLALAATMTGNESDTPTTADLSERRRLSDQAIEALTKAVNAGYRDLQQLRANVQLDILRPRSDFKRLLAKVEKDETTGSVVKPAPNRDEEKRKATQTTLQNRTDLAAGLYGVGVLFVSSERNASGRAALDEALKLQETLRQEDPDHARQHQAAAALTRVALGRSDWHSGEYAKAFARWKEGIDTLERLHRAAADDEQMKRPLSSSLLTRANSLAKSGIWEDAARDLSRYIELTPGDSWQAFRLTMLLLYTGEETAFRKQCATLLERTSRERNSGLLSQAVLACLLTPQIVGESGELERRLNQSLPSASPEIRVRIAVLKGMLAYRSQKFEEAARLLEDGLHGLPNPVFRALGYHYLAMTQHRLGRTAEARLSLEQGRRSSREPFSLVRRGDFSGNGPEWAALEVARLEAEKLVEGSSHRDPDERIHRGRIFSLAGQEKRAEDEFAAVVRDHPNDVSVLITRGRILAQLDHPKRAQTDLDRAVEIAPKDAQTWIARGQFFWEQGREADADADFAKAATLSSGELNKFIEAGWWVIGPFPELLATPYSPEKVANGAHVSAAAFESDEYELVHLESNDQGYVNLGPAFEQAEHISAYALSIVHAPEERSATLMVGADDGARVWVNGRLVHEMPGYRLRHSYSLDRVPITLKAGRNTLLVKVYNATGNHNFHVRLADNPLDRAFTLAELGLFPEALAQSREAFRRQAPTAFQPWHRQAMLLVLAGETEAYQHHCRLMLERYGNNVDAYTSYSLALACNLMPNAAKDYGVVLRQAERASRASRGRASEVFEQAIARLRLGQAQRAIKDIEGSNALVKQPRTWPILALAHHELGHATDARQWLQKAEDAYKKSLAEALASSSLRLVQEGSNVWEYVQLPIFLREAQKTITGSVPKDDPLFAQYQKRSRDWLKNARANEVDYDVAILLAPRTERFWLARGRYFAEKKDTDKAAQDFVQALTLVKDSPNPWVQDRGGIDEALIPYNDVFTKVAEVRPTDAQLWIARARYYAQRRQWKPALAAAEKALERDPENCFSWFCIAPLRIEAGDVEGYRKLCHAMLERFVSVNTSYAAEQTAKTCLLIPGAVDDIETIVRLTESGTKGSEKDPNHPWFLLARGLAEYRLGHDDEAITWLQKSLDFADKRVLLEATDYLLLAMAKQRLGRVDEARQDFEKAEERERRYTAGSETLASDWHDWLRYQILRREAERIIPGPTTVSQKDS